VDKQIKINKENDVSTASKVLAHGYNRFESFNRHKNVSYKLFLSLPEKTDLSNYFLIFKRTTENLKRFQFYELFTKPDIAVINLRNRSYSTLNIPFKLHYKFADIQSFEIHFAAESQIISV